MFDSHAVLSELVLKAKDVEMATFVPCLDAAAVDVFNKLLFANGDDEKDLETVLKGMGKHLISQTDVIFERFEFHEQKGRRRNNEPVHCSSVQPCAKVRLS